MRRELTVAAVLAAFCLAAMPTSARGLLFHFDPFAPHRPRLYPPNAGFMPIPWRFHRRMGSQRAGPSDAVAAVQQRYPGATVLAVRRLPNGDFVVTIRLGNQLRRVRVDGATGQPK